MFGAVGTNPRPPQSVFPSRPSPVSAPRIAAAKAAPELIPPRQNKSERKIGAGLTVITRKVYPKLVELHIAGRSYREIAQRLGVSEREVRLHTARAMAAYRNGRLRIRGGQCVEEARRVGEERSQLGLNGPVQNTADPPAVNAEAISGISLHA